MPTVILGHEPYLWEIFVSQKLRKENKVIMDYC